MPRSLFTRILHTALTIAILHQLVVSWFMERPRPGGGGNLGYELHQAIGLASIGILGLFWAWTVVRQREHGLADLLPWFSVQRRRAVLQDIAKHARSLVQCRLPDPEDETPLASAVHGLGLLAATAMALTGLAVFVMMGQDGALVGPGRLFLDVHRVAANAMWAYLIGHAALALLHQVAGHLVLERIFLGR